MTNVFVVDAIMGSGKTTWAIEKINSEPDQKYIVCTPFLNEIKRFRNSVNRELHEPTFYEGRKIDDFNRLLKEGKSIAVTHSTFSNASEDTYGLLQENNYKLILDEVLETLCPYNQVYDDNVNKSDIDLLINEGFIEVDKYGAVKWIKNSYPDSKYSNIEFVAKSGNLYCIDDTILAWVFPYKMFLAFDETYCLTYLFESSVLNAYFEYYNISFEKKSIVKNLDGYELAEYRDDYEIRKSLKSLIRIYQNEKSNDYEKTALSKAWFEKQDAAKIVELKNHLKNYLKNRMNASADRIMWTCLKNYYDNLKGGGYTCIRRISAEEKKRFSTNEILALEKKLSCFVPINAKATNDYGERNVLSYVHNMYLNPYVKRFFERKNIHDGANIELNEDAFALSVMLQWIWRSDIRNGNPIDIYIPSTRMRNLLIQWLG